MCDSDRFVAAIEKNWPDYTIAPGTIRESCCIDHGPDCPACNGIGFDVDTSEDCERCAGEGSLPLSEVSDEELEIWNEGSFSWSECDSCGSTLGGNRYNAHALPAKPSDSEIHHLSICADCLFFHANGDLPDDWQP